MLVMLGDSLKCDVFFNLLLNQTQRLFQNSKMFHPRRRLCAALIL